MVHAFCAYVRVDWRLHLCGFLRLVDRKLSACGCGHGGQWVGVVGEGFEACEAVSDMHPHGNIYDAAFRDHCTSDRAQNTRLTHSHHRTVSQYDNKRQILVASAAAVRLTNLYS